MNVQTHSLREMIETLPENSTLVLHEVSWAEYEDMLALLPDTARFRLSYDRGTLQIMTLSPRHERLKSLFTPLLTVLAEEENLNLVSLGSTTFKRAGAARGLEPDDGLDHSVGQVLNLACQPFGRRGTARRAFFRRSHMAKEKRHGTPCPYRWPMP